MDEAPPRKWIRLNTVSLGLATRIVVAGVLTFVACHLLALQQSHWAILSAIIVMQASVGASLKATLNRLAGSIGGALWGVCVLVALPRETAVATGLALAVTLLPLATLAAFKPAFRVAPITGVILLLTPMPQDSGPWLVGLNRVLEVGIGSIVAVAVALTVFPIRAHDRLTRSAAHALRLLADLIDQLSQTIAGRGEQQTISELHHEIRHAIMQAEDIAEEAQQERLSYLVHAPDPLPVCRTLRRLRHDLTLIDRTVESPMTTRSLDVLVESAEHAATVIGAFLRSAAEALAHRRTPPAMTEVEEALTRHAAAVAEARRSRAIRDLPDEQVARIFGLAFGFVQLSENLDDLAARIEEFAGVRTRKKRRLKSRLFP